MTKRNSVGKLKHDIKGLNDEILALNSRKEYVEHELTIGNLKYDHVRICEFKKEHKSITSSLSRKLKTLDRVEKELLTIEL